MSITSELDCVAPPKKRRRALYMTELLIEIDDNPDVLGRLSDEEREVVEGRGCRRSYAVGEIVFEQGRRHDGIFVIESGRVRSYYVGANAREITLAYWTPGHFVGGPEIFGGGEHIWTAEATEPSEILHLSGLELRSLVQTMPHLATGLIEALVHKGKCYSALLQLLGTRSVSNRLAHLILTLARRFGTPHGPQIVIETTFTDFELANMIGSTRQWVSTTLGRFESEGLIKRQGRRIIVRKVAALEDMSV